jgi:hypothetical protein
MDSRQIVWLLVLFVALGLVVLAVHNDNTRQEQCVTAHHGKPFNVENFVTKTEDGCTVKSISSFNANCDFLGHFYVTNCAGFCWDTGSKPRVRTCNLKEHK